MRLWGFWDEVCFVCGRDMKLLRLKKRLLSTIKQWLLICSYLYLDTWVSPHTASEFHCVDCFGRWWNSKCHTVGLKTAHSGVLPLLLILDLCCHRRSSCLAWWMMWDIRLPGYPGWLKWQNDKWLKIKVSIRHPDIEVIRQRLWNNYH